MVLPSSGGGASVHLLYTAPVVVCSTTSKKYHIFGAGASSKIWFFYGGKLSLRVLLDQNFNSKDNKQPNNNKNDVRF